MRRARGAAADGAGGAVEVRTLEAFRETMDPDAVYTEREFVAPHVDTYRRELERFLLWAIVERGVALSSLRVSEVEGKRKAILEKAEKFAEALKETFGEAEIYGISADVTFEEIGYGAYPAR
ncbi:hypothetical protein [Burkholderia ubonensis]|uniref:hypothetical protein n=1 Tax=Burkholderia ubonensis TaxID=101571 RepID=UPI00358FE45D